ncbi:MAG: tRNA (adenosine(37)-N6)-dimethylallyltransferase MiaA [Clostridiaceae bacterium]|jgi:tRNA dimethylallyltransferase|nr:tRNA (adenosine(37)-N6)-dimethylallyltransferase MiaA [Clostridiaceae bacterium]
MRKIIVVAGATASGKSAFALRLAQDLGGAVISADSMQIYRHLNVGTAKATEIERASVPHYLIDIAEPDAEFSVAAFKECADDAISDALARGLIPIVAGGTGLYIDALLYNMSFSGACKNSEVRERLQAEAAIGLDALYTRLAALDPVSAARIHANDAKRIVRALEIIETTGEPVKSDERIPRYDFLGFCMTLPREVLYKRINNRVDSMIEGGLEREVADVTAKTGFGCQSMQAIGYKEFKAYFEGLATLEETKELIKKNTRNYAKRQITWFKKTPLIPLYPDDWDECVRLAREFLNF